MKRHSMHTSNEDSHSDQIVALPGGLQGERDQHQDPTQQNLEEGFQGEVSLDSHFRLSMNLEVYDMVSV